MGPLLPSFYRWGKARADLPTLAPKHLPPGPRGPPGGQWLTQPRRRPRSTVLVPPSWPLLHQLPHDQHDAVEAQC